MKNRYIELYVQHNIENMTLQELRDLYVILETEIDFRKKINLKYKNR
mgnify:CR=1 FL=1|tara:strand:+ start:789 stop:929 length:141 start_codon:yes stop_codon:yes gene_type:complete